MTETKEVELIEPVVTQARELIALDRCDHGGCSAQAYVIVQYETGTEGIENPGELLFCGHHFAKYEKKLGEFMVADNREALLAPLTAAY